MFHLSSIPRGHTKMSLENVADGRIEAARITGGAGLLTIWGYTLEHWVGVLTCVYFAFNIIILMPKVVFVLGGFVDWLKGKNVKSKPEND